VLPAHNFLGVLKKEAKMCCAQIKVWKKAKVCCSCNKIIV